MLFRSMDFIMGLPRTRGGYDSIWVIVDRLTKVAHFIPVGTTYTGAKLAELYMTRLCVYMGYLRRLYLIGDHSSHLGFGKSYMILWILNSGLVQLTIPKQMDRQREQTRFWKICYVLVLYSMVLVGIKACHTQSSLTIMVIKPV